MERAEYKAAQQTLRREADGVADKHTEGQGGNL